MSNQNEFTYSQGSGDPIDVTIRDGTGAACTTYAGTEALTCEVWPGGNRAVSFSPVATWTDPGTWTGTDPVMVNIAITAAQTNAMDPGTYRLLLRIDDGDGPVDAYKCRITITRSAGADVATATYTTLEDLETHGGSWLSQVQGDDDEAGFWEQQEKALDWLQRLGHAHFRIGGLAFAGCGGPIIVGGRSPWLQAEFDAGHLTVTPEIKEMCANYALYLICKSQIGLGDSSAQYAKLARMYKSTADYIATCTTLEIVSDTATVARIPLGNIDPLYG